MILSNVNKYNTVGKRFWAGMIDGLVFIPFPILHAVLNTDTNMSMYISVQTANVILWNMYLVIGHGKYGQTLGKKAMGVKVLDISEERLIGYKRAFLRECILFFFSAGFIIYLVSKTGSQQTPEDVMRESNLGFYFPLIWFALEIVTTLTNLKYRALHDYIAGSVVIRLDAKDQNAL